MNILRRLVQARIYLYAAFAVLLIFSVKQVNAVSYLDWTECQQGQTGYSISSCRVRAINHKGGGGPSGAADEFWYKWAITEPQPLPLFIACGLAPNASSCVLVSLGSGPALLIEPTTVTTPQGQAFSADIKIDSFGNQVVGTDAYIQYDATALQFVQILNGDYFPSVTQTDQSGVLSLRGMFTEPASSRAGIGRVATVTFQPLREVITDLSFICTSGAGLTSKIIKNDVNATNVIDCTANNTLRVTVGSATLTPTGVITTSPTTSPTPDTSVTPSQCNDDNDDGDGDNDGDEDCDSDDGDDNHSNDSNDNDDDNDSDDDGDDNHSNDNNDNNDDDDDGDDDDNNNQVALRLAVMLIILLFVVMSVVLGV